MTGRTRDPIVIVGAGPAGLAAAQALLARNVPVRVLERGPDVGHVWRNLYDSLRLHTGKHLSALPGLRFDRATPLFPHRTDFVRYLERYRERFRIPVDCNVDVLEVQPPANGGGWTLHTSGGTITAGGLVMATGIVSCPRMPALPGRDQFAGRVLHSVEYRRPEPFVGRRVLVVGCGNSGGEIGAELANAGARVSVAVRSGANVVPLTLLGLPIQYIAFALRPLPKRARQAIAAAVARVSEARRGPPVLPRPPHGPLDAIPLIGFHLVDAIRAGLIDVRASLVSLTRSGVRFSDGTEEEYDDVILATGFDAAIQPLGERVSRDARGFARRSDRVTSAELPALWFIGHNYDTTGGLQNIGRDAPLIAERVMAMRAGEE